MASPILTGARARFSINGVKVGYATGVSVRESLTHEPIKVLDEIQVKEHVPVDYEVSITADMIRLIGTTLKSLGWFPKQGATPKAHLDNILAIGEMYAHIEDSSSGDLITVVEGVRVSERNVNITSRGVVGENVTMVALRVRDESDLS